MFKMHVVIMHDLTKLQIEHAAFILRNAGAIDVDFYELKLRQNAGDRAQVINHLSEAKVALMFLESGAKVTMQDRPDLKIEWLGVVFYAEVKHFNRKEPDQHDEAAMRSARNELAMDGDIRKSEGRSSYEQMSDVARKKTPQYVDGAINILVIDSSSDCMDYVDEMALSGMREYNEELRKTPNDVALRRLHGIMLISDWGSVGPNSRNVGFAMAWKASPPHMRGELYEALRSISRG